MHNKRDGKVAVGAETDRHKGKITRSTAKQKSLVDGWIHGCSGSSDFGNVAVRIPGSRGVGGHGRAKELSIISISPPQ